MRTRAFCIELNPEYAAPAPRLPRRGPLLRGRSHLALAASDETRPRIAGEFLPEADVLVAVFGMLEKMVQGGRPRSAEPFGVTTAATRPWGWSAIRSTTQRGNAQLVRHPPANPPATPPATPRLPPPPPQGSLGRSSRKTAGGDPRSGHPSPLPPGPPRRRWEARLTEQPVRVSCHSPPSRGH
jgi:hypothetical protein